MSGHVTTPMTFGESEITSEPGGIIPGLKTIKGIYRNGTVELPEPVPPDVQREVIMTFLESGEVDLAARGDAVQAADVRHWLAAVADDWEHPAMNVYDED